MGFASANPRKRATSRWPFSSRGTPGARRCLSRVRPFCALRSRLRRRTLGLSVALAAPMVVGCAHARGPSSAAASRGGESASEIERAEAALAADDGARAVALFRRVLEAEDLDDAQRLRVYPGLARAYESVGDFEQAIRSYTGALELPLPAVDLVRAELLARMGAAQAELERWEDSEATLVAAYGALEADALPSTRVELLARRAYAQFSSGALEPCLATLDEAEAVYARAQAEDTERFSTFYFVGMMRFYRAAVLHARFRAIEVSLPETQMAKDFEAKLALLTQAQDAYNATIETKHVYWVSAAGFQLGHLFEEFYDALMHAPVPEWLDESQRRVYYEELKAQLRPVVNKAIWVFEKNLEASRRLGYETEFTQETEAALARLQELLLASDVGLGEPHPELAPLGDASARAPEAASAVEDALFLPEPTPL